jgi:hypothetical protein
MEGGIEMLHRTHHFRNLLISGLAVVGLASYAPGGPAGEATMGAGERQPESVERISISIDPRIELLAVVQHFTPWAQGGHIKSPTQYKEEIEIHFGDFRDHPAVACAERLIDAGFSHDAPVTFVLHHGHPPELAYEIPYSDYLIRRAGGEDRLMEFSHALSDFAQQADFMDFYRSHQAFYDTLITEVRVLLKGKDYVRAIEDLFGESRNSYTLILSPLFAGGYGPTIDTEDGYDVYGVIGPCALRGKRTTFACIGFLESMMLHEWSHSFVNPLVDRNFGAFEVSTHLFEPIRGMMKRQAYPTWRISLYEHIVRACETHLRSRLYQDFNKGAALAYQEGKGFWYISHIDSLLGLYEARREEFPAFSQFMPVIARSLSTISVEDLPERITSFVGPLDAIFPRTDAVYFVYPTAVDRDASDQIRKDLEGLGHFLAAAGIQPLVISDKQALRTDWDEKVAFIYASPGGNLFLESLQIAIPVVFSEDTLEFGGHRYDNEDILLISCMPNPFNKTLPFALAVANAPTELVGAGLRMSAHSEWGVDYVIFRGDDQLTSGRYRKDQGEWFVAPE